MNANNFLIAFFCIIGIAIIIVEAARYLANRKRRAKCPEEVGLTAPNQKYVLKNLKKFGVSNKGTSLDKRDIYLIDYDELGL